MRYFILALIILSTSLWADPLIGIPKSPKITGDGYQLILDYECGGGKYYYDRFLIHPEWPGLSSGITIGIGEDIGYVSKDTFLSDWRDLSEKNRLVPVVGMTGQRAKAHLYEVRDIIVKWELAEKVFNDVTIARYYALTKRTFPEFESLAPTAQAALISLVFNRGSSLAGPGRIEMREISRLTPSRNYREIAVQLRKMKRLWPDTRGLRERRDAEANLIESCAKN